MTLTWNPPAIIDPRRLRLSAYVRAAVEKLRPDVLCVPQVGMGKLLAGVGALGLSAHETVAGIRPRVIVSESDPALRAVWEAAQRGELTEAADLARFLYNDRVIWHVEHGGHPWIGLCHDGEDRSREVEGRVCPAAWAIAVAAGAGAWRRDAQGRFDAPLAPGELTKRIFPPHHVPSCTVAGDPAHGCGVCEGEDTCTCPKNLRARSGRTCSV